MGILSKGKIFVNEYYKFVIIFVIIIKKEAEKFGGKIPLRYLQQAKWDIIIYTV